WISLGRKHHREEPLAIPPVNVGEIHERRSADHHDRVEIVLCHQLARSLDPLLALLNRDGLRLGLARLEFRDRLRQRLSSTLRLRTNSCRLGQGECPRQSCRTHEVSPRMFAQSRAPFENSIEYHLRQKP